MHRAHPYHLRLIGLAVIVAVNGCDIRKYRVVTRIEQDGTLARAITQARDETLPPEALVAPKTYPPSTQPADYAIRPEWADLWNTKKPDLQAKEGDEGKLVEAGGTFATAALIPRSYHIVPSPLEDRASVNRIAHNFNDFGLFGIDDWTETITETIRLDEYAETIDEMTRMLIPPAQATFDELFGAQYDFAEMHAFARERLAPIARRFALLLFQTGAHGGGTQPSPEDWRMLKEMLRPAAFELPLNEEGTQLNNEVLGRVLREYCRDVFMMTVRLKTTGQYLTPDQAEDLLLTLGWKPEPEPQSQPASESEQPDTAAGAPPPASQPTAQEASPWDGAHDVFSRHFLAMHGRSLESISLLWGAQAGGAHRRGPLSFFDPAPKPHNREYHYELTTAGPIIETNGRRVAANAVEWSFAADDLWPLGYKMHAVAIRWNRNAEKRLFGQTVLGDMDAVLDLRKAIGDRQPVKEAIQQAIEQGSLDPLHKLAADDSEEAKVASTILGTILGLATRPAP